MKEKLDDLASEIALPFMVGAGTISLTIVMNHHYPLLRGVIALAVILTVNFGFIWFLKCIRDGLSNKKFEVAFDKNMEILLRLNGFFVGAIGVNMMVTVITNTII